MAERNYRKCKTCKDLKIRISDGKFPNNKNKRFRDDKNAHWHGNVCGDCNKIRVNELMKAKRKG